LSRVVDSLPLQSYLFPRRVKQSLYLQNYTKHVLFELDLEIKDPAISQYPIYIKLLDQGSFRLSHVSKEGEFERVYKFNQRIYSPYFNGIFTLRGKSLSKEDLEGLYFLKIQENSTITAELSNKIQVEPLDLRTKSVKISMTDRNAKKAKEITQKLVDVFLEYDVEKKSEGFTNILSFLNKNINEFEKDYSVFEDSLTALKANAGFIENTGAKSVMVDKLSVAETQMKSLSNDFKTLMIFKEYANKSQTSDIPILTFADPRINLTPAILKLNELRNQRNSLLLDVTKDHPKVRLIDNQLEDAKIDLAKNIDNAVYGLETSLKQLSQEYGINQEKLYDLPKLEADLNRLKKLKDAKESFFLNLVDQRSNYLIANAGVVSDYVVLQRAAESNVPISPNVTLIRLLGVFLGLILGFLLVFLRYFLHKTIISVQEVEYKCKAPLLGVVPNYLEKLERSQIVVTKDPKSSIAEAYRGIRSNLQFINNEPGSKVISTTSTIPGEGKTFTALNIGAIISMMGKKVVIVDCDLRKPRLNKIFNCDNSKGASVILSSQVEVEDCILPTGLQNIDFIPSGPVPPNPSELILLPKMQEMIDYLKTKYDYVIIDTPPIGLVTDALRDIAQSRFSNLHTSCILLKSFFYSKCK
jgi:tyrosine-protein kinase Etk/Wzc